MAGTASFDSLLDVAQRIVHSGVEVTDKPTEQLRFRERFLELAREIEKMQKARHEAGRISDADLQSARYLRLDAEIQVLKAKKLASSQQNR